MKAAPGAAWLLVLGLWVGCADTPALDRYDLGGDFQLIDASGQTFQLSRDSGGVRLLFFGFTACPDVCPATMSLLGQVLADLPQSGAQVLFVSVDPVHDTPPQLARYADNWDFPVHGLTGSPADIRQVVAQYGASFKPGATGGVDHSSRIYLLDGTGQIRFLFSQDDPVARIVAVTRTLLQEESES